MARIDVSSILSDPDFQDLFSVQRTTETVGNDGLGVRTLYNYAAQGVVQTATGDDLVQLPEGTRANDALAVWTTWPVSINTVTQETDQIVWAGYNWRVHSIEDWSNYGMGYRRVLCIRTALG